MKIILNYEILKIEAVDIEIENAEEQKLTAIKYHQIIREKANDKVSHSETGYWIWDNDNDTIMCAFSIPRGVSLLAGGAFEISTEEEVTFNVSSKLGDNNWGIIQSPFMEKKAKTIAFKREMKLLENSLSYSQNTTLEIYGKTFDHIDNNTLIKIE